MGTSAPELYTVGSAGKFVHADYEREYDGDPRGFLCIWEPPSKSSLYSMGIDVSVGLSGWNRFSRVKQDRKTDNGAIEVIRCGINGKPDYQVAEYAGPVDPFELGDIANLMGRMYAGTEDDQCKCIIEVHPGPGFGTLQRMLEAGYTNHFRWEYYADSPASQTRTLAFGWHASARTNRDLWVKASRHLNLRNVIIRSPWLTEEYADCRMDPAKGMAENPGGHDDRVRAMNLAIWQANGWSMNIERTQEVVQSGAPKVDWQCSDLTPDEIMAQWGMALDRMS
jgi:hypothetical protein